MRALRISVTTIMTLALWAGSTIGATAQSDEPEAASRPPVPSAGCGTAGIGMLAGERGSAVLGGIERSWRLWVPTAHDDTTPLPLVMWFHQLGGSATDMDATTRLSTLAEERGYIAVAPQAPCSPSRWFAGCGDEPVSVDTSAANPDIVFTSSLIDRLGEELCIDLARVYVTGYASGGYHATRVGCVLEDRIAAIAPVAGGYDLGDACVLDRPVPVIFFQGANDEHVLFEGGYSQVLQDWVMDEGVRFGDLAGTRSERDLLSFPERLVNIAVRNGCDPEPASESLGDGIERRTWACPDGADVEFFVHDGSHQWDLGSSELDTTELILDFFEHHPMPE